MNILYRACASKRGYQSRILKELYKKGIFDKCTVITQTLDGKDNYPKEIYHEIPAYIGYSANYNNICDMEMLPEVPEQIMLGMAKYESTALNMTCRNYHMHIMYYDEMYKEYLEHVKFWNWILDKDKIEFVFLITVPHHVWEYVLYSLAKVKNIPVLLEMGTGISGLNEVGTSIETKGQNVKKYYDLNKECKMDENVQNYFNQVLESRSYIPIKKQEKMAKKCEKWIYETYYKSFIERILKNETLFKDIVEKRTKSKLKKDLLLHRQNLKTLFRLISAKKNIRNREYYNRNIAQAVNYNKKYILYALHYWPEAVTLPNGGVFWNQLPVIKMLAKCAQKRGISVYVKEHWNQWGRTSEFYRELRSIPNVYLLSTNEDTYKLIDHAVAVSTLSGTCINECIIKGIPVLKFANNYMCGAPGVYRVGSEAEIDKVLNIIMSDNYSIDPVEVKRYYATLSNTLVKGYLDWPCNPVYNLKDCISDTVQLIEKFVNEGMPEDFCYVRTPKM